MTDPRMTPTNEAPVTVEQFSLYSEINALTGPRNEDGEYNAGYADGHSRAVFDALEILKKRGFADGGKRALASAPADVIAAVRGITDDYMTSEAHHPGYVLIPVERFDMLREAEASLASAPAGDGAEEIEKLIRQHFAGAVIHDDYRENGHAMRDEIDACEGVGDLARQIAALARPRAAVGERQAADTHANNLHLIGLLRREAAHSGVWFAEHLSRAADLLTEAIAKPRAALRDRNHLIEIVTEAIHDYAADDAGIARDHAAHAVTRILALQSPPAKVEGQA